MHKDWFVCVTERMCYDLMLAEHIETNTAGVVSLGIVGISGELLTKVGLKVMDGRGSMEGMLK